METLLLTVSGTDRPGVTAALTEALSHLPITVVDLEQIVIRGHLTLGMLLAAESNGDLAREILSEAAQVAQGIIGREGMELSVVHGTDALAAHHSGALLVTVLGLPLRPAAVAAITSRIASLGANIHRISRVAAYPVTAIEFEVTGAEQSQLRAALAEQAAASSVDIAVQRAGLARRSAHLVVMDVDSTLIQDEVIELLAVHANNGAAVAEITERAMRGELDFAESLRERVALLAGLPESILTDVREQIRLTPGARTLTRTLSRLGYHLALVSGGFHEVIDPIAEDLGIEHVRANRLEVREGVLTGRVVPPIVDRAGKAQALCDFAAEHGVPLSRTVAIGDGANDLDMLGVAGLGVAFNAKPLVRAAADAAVNVPYLDAVLYLLGITREQIEQADLEDGIVTSSPLVEHHHARTI